MAEYRPLGDTGSRLTEWPQELCADLRRKLFRLANHFDGERLDGSSGLLRERLLRPDTVRKIEALWKQKWPNSASPDLKRIVGSKSTLQQLLDKGRGKRAYVHDLQLLVDLVEVEGTTKATVERVAETPVLARLKQRPLRVGWVAFAPFVDAKRDGRGREPSGIYPLILRHIAKAEGLSLEFQELRWDRAIDAIEKGRVDVVAALINTPKRRQKVRFVGRLCRIGLGALIRKSETRLVKPVDLRRPDIRIAVVRGEMGWEYVSDTLHLLDNTRVITIDSTEVSTAGALVYAEEADVALIDALSCEKCIKKYTRMQDLFRTQRFQIEDLALAVSQSDQAFADWLDAQVELARQHPEVVKAERAQSRFEEGVVHVI